MQKLAQYLEKQQVLDKLGRKLSKRIDAVLEQVPQRKLLLDFLHGTWLGHPLHAALVAVPIGAFTVAAALDALSLVTGGKSRAARPAIVVGLLGALAAAPSGLVDWHNLTDRQRRIGLGHAMINSAALGCYLSSLAFRLAGAGPARATAFLGYGLVNASAFLGGDLVYRLQAGVAHAPIDEPPEEYEVPLANITLTEGTMMRVDAGGYPILLARSGGAFRALGDVCPHLACSLTNGTLEDGRVVCSCHGSAFALDDGRVLAGPATSPVQAFIVEDDGRSLCLHPRRDD